MKHMLIEYKGKKTAQDSREYVNLALDYGEYIRADEAVHVAAKKSSQDRNKKYSVVGK